LPNLVRISQEHIQLGLDHLRERDEVMHRLIRAVGPFQLRLEHDRFKALVRSILSQQISGSAARSIYRKLETLLGPGGFTAETLAQCTVAQLRTAGVSPQKAGYLLDLATKVAAGNVRLRGLQRLHDAAIIEQLVLVKGIGVWTAQMFLIFSLGRLDVFPSDDLGIRVALQNLYGLRDLPDRKRSHALAEPWRPFATIASWYCWRSLDLAKESSFANGTSTPGDTASKKSLASDEARVK
jgi:DNA-3-methyladenine glycosylase II